VVANPTGLSRLPYNGSIFSGSPRMTALASALGSEITLLLLLVTADIKRARSYRGNLFALPEAMAAMQLKRAVEEEPRRDAEKAAT
jgi:hypothetical protein